MIRMAYIYTNLRDVTDPPGRRAALPSPGVGRVCVHEFFDTAEPGHHLPITPWPVLPSTKQKVSALRIVLSMLNSSARIPRYRRFTRHLAVTRARLAERHGMACSFAAEDFHLLSKRQLAWRSRIRVSRCGPGIPQGARDSSR